ncbi:hypothetical protein HO173_007889 [Letharia columbiana]|uniref:Uncharacterized protein n=1 Tax=Letharia columbiana TaxID=112416 RepID=A0A8H6FST7_9LECA|nr:uncharacterized protein HO173_007889 [Letharia columbiana]KAF6234059.1 hypothetical protein HO173_007889 [Letharia columbiana]
MSVYVVTGVSKGIGFEFLRQIWEDQKNLVVGLVRDKAATEKKIAAELGDRHNIHILHADLTKYASLKQAAADTAETIGERGIDYLVANGALVPYLDTYGPIGALSDKVEEVDAVSSQLSQTNVVGNIHLFHLFLPLVLKGKVKKVLTICNIWTFLLMGFMGKLVTYAPHFKGPISPEESVRHVRSTWEKASIEGGFGGAFVSHLGNKQWV